MKPILTISLTGSIQMFNLTNTLVDIIVICICCIVVIFIFVLYRSILIKKYYKKFSHDVITKNPTPNEKYTQPQFINPIVSDYKSYLKIYKLEKNFTPKNFFNNLINNTTIFIKLDKNNDYYKNNY